VTPAFENLRDRLKKLPGLGYRSAERVALHLLVEQPESLAQLQQALRDAGDRVGRCKGCGNLSESDLCPICADDRRQAGSLCVVERVPDLLSMERAGVHRGHYVVLHGKLSPINGIGPEDLNFAPLREKVENGTVEEIILALSNDIEGQATCHYIQQEILGSLDVPVTRLGYGLPSAAEITFADPATLKNAFETRRRLDG